MAVELPRYVLDASVAAKWYLPDEAHATAADVVLSDFRDGRVSLLAPSHIRYEVPSAIRNALRMRRLTHEQAYRAIVGFLAWPIRSAGDGNLIAAAFELAVRFGCSLYDGLYLALAEATGIPLLHADSRLRNSLGDRFPLAVWIADYGPAAP